MINKRDLLRHAVEVLVVVAFIQFVARFAIVHGFSMEGTLHDGDIVVVWQLGYQPKQGDVVVIHKDNPLNSYLTKRVIGIGGQHIISDGRQVTVDGIYIQEPYVKGGIQSSVSFEQEIPAGTIFVLGDNRDYSIDSRSFGCLPEKVARGKVVFRIWPLNRISLI